MFSSDFRSAGTAAGTPAPTCQRGVFSVALRLSPARGRHRTVAHATARAEAELQELLEANLHLLPGAQIARENPGRWLEV